MAVQAGSVIGRIRRHKRIRKKVTGTSYCPRLNVFRSSKHIYCQIIDDTRGLTLVSASTLDKEVKDAISSGKKKSEKGGKIDSAKLVGSAIARGALEKGIDKVVFDRSGYLYHGRVKALADGAREGGLKF